MGFKICNWASLIVGSKFTFFALFYFVFEGSFSKNKPPGSLHLEGQFNGRFLRYRFGGAYIWRYGGPQVHSQFQMILLIFKHTPNSNNSLLILKVHT